MVVNLPDKPSEVQDVNLTVDGVAGNNSDPEPIETDNAQNNTDNGVGQQGTQVTGTGGNTPDANANAGASNAAGQNPMLMQQGSSATPQSKGGLSPTSDGVVNQILGQDQGMLPVVKGGAGAGLR